ncbi:MULTISPECIES: MarR family winged helix-turn-helix transcriptional regulator [Clostridium]|uniref:Predicted transcriptional regulator n=2 Tax=Clostridium TaxID=1485 RepID=D8GUG6_CLOLD|nr:MULTISPECIES: MarR family transcriptional regulator [Clostridium]ADK14829.1 predicted transcriptional regulator [Clostridium ljungdahlii DSM 13528]AGY78075.1 MarR family transcriptional regulator [Clostridium autoethanogenum DSM 10061]ALU38209.1 Transcriptional regulator MarR family [Clostridium autoethanogenum DSM 10061]OAA87825.1 Transcriptional repressor MprA [Clostridium ljungdahlii DSM 13528]OVY50972.1 Transcriptional repressor MprA [Clostridium autoethanogenum]
MSKSNKKQIEEFSELWHQIIKKSNFRKIEDQFQRLNGLTTIEISIINIVSKNPDVILGEIVLALDIPKSTLTNAINRLEKRNYINRIISKRDRRSYGLKLTEEGHLAQKEHLDFEHTVYGRLLDALDTDEEKQELFKLFRKMINNLEE